MADNLLHAPTALGLRADLGSRLAKLRLARNITQESLAKEAGVSVRTLRRLEAGSPSSLDTFLRITVALGLADEVAGAIPASHIRPIERMQFRRGERLRASSASKEASTKPWVWGEESRD